MDEQYVMDFSLFRVAKQMRLLGCDVACDRSIRHSQVLAIAKKEDRIIVTASKKFVPHLEACQRTDLKDYPGNDHYFLGEFDPTVQIKNTAAYRNKSAAVTSAQWSRSANASEMGSSSLPNSLPSTATTSAHSPPASAAAGAGNNSDSSKGIFPATSKEVSSQKVQEQATVKKEVDERIHQQLLTKENQTPVEKKRRLKGYNSEGESEYETEEEDEKEESTKMAAGQQPLTVENVQQHSSSSTKKEKTERVLKGYNSEGESEYETVDLDDEKDDVNGGEDNLLSVGSRTESSEHDCDDGDSDDDERRDREWKAKEKAEAEKLQRIHHRDPNARGVDDEDLEQEEEEDGGARGRRSNNEEAVDEYFKNQVMGSSPTSPHSPTTTTATGGGEASATSVVAASQHATTISSSTTTTGGGFQKKKKKKGQGEEEDDPLVSDPPIRFILVNPFDPFRVQVESVVQRMKIAWDPAKVFSRCVQCNGTILAVPEKDTVKDEVNHTVFRLYNNFYRCNGCRRVYWGMDEGVLVNYKALTTVEHAKQLCLRAQANSDAPKRTEPDRKLSKKRRGTAGGGDAAKPSTTFSRQNLPNSHKEWGNIPLAGLSNDIRSQGLRIHLYAYPRNIKCTIISYLTNDDHVIFLQAYPVFHELVGVVQRGDSWSFKPDKKKNKKVKTPQGIEPSWQQN